MWVENLIMLSITITRVVTGYEHLCNWGVSLIRHRYRMQYLERGNQPQTRVLGKEVLT